MKLPETIDMYELKLNLKKEWNTDENIDYAAIVDVINEALENCTNETLKEMLERLGGKSIMYKDAHVPCNYLGLLAYILPDATNETIKKVYDEAGSFFISSCNIDEENLTINYFTMDMGKRFAFSLLSTSKIFATASIKGIESEVTDRKFKQQVLIHTTR